MARRRRSKPRISFMGRKRLKNGKLSKGKVRITFPGRPRRRSSRRAPKRLAKFVAKVKAGKVIRNRNGRFVRFTR